MTSANKQCRESESSLMGVVNENVNLTLDTFSRMKRGNVIVAPTGPGLSFFPIVRFVNQDKDYKGKASKIVSNQRELFRFSNADETWIFA